MEQGIRSAVCDKREGGIGPNHIVKLVIVDMERFFFESSEIITRRNEYLRNGQLILLLLKFLEDF